MDDFTVTSDRATDGRTVVGVRGDLDLDTAGHLWAAVEPLLAPEAVVVLDAAAMPFLDSSGLRVLLQAARRAAEVGAAFRLAAPGPAVLRVFDLAGVTTQLAVRGTLADALAG